MNKKEQYALVVRVRGADLPYVLEEKLGHDDGDAWWRLGRKRPKYVREGMEVFLCAGSQVRGVAVARELREVDGVWQVVWNRSDGHVIEPIDYEGPMRGWMYAPEADYIATLQWWEMPNEEVSGE